MPAIKKRTSTLHLIPSNNAAKCSRCSAECRKEFSGELAIHFTGLAGLSKPIVWVFPKLLVCLNCGLAEFTVPERELHVLETGIPDEGAAA
jgi:hypothetical protein